MGASDEDLARKLRAAGIETRGVKLEPWQWLVNLGPPGALDGISAYRLVDAGATPARDAPGRNWRPLLELEDEVLVGPDPQILDELLKRSGYFDRPEAFGDMLLLQFHRFALDFYLGYQVREKSFDRQGGGLVVRGDASRGAGEELEVVAFETSVGRDSPARFAAG
jgi:hypothetical protein